MKRKAIAVDFDGTLCTNEWPMVGEPNWPVINRAIEEQKSGAGIILWTCREGEDLERAVNACKEWGLVPDAVNESLPEWLEEWKINTRKVGATEYWDDRAVNVQHIVNEPLTYAELWDMSGTPVWIVWPDGRIRSQWWIVGSHEWNMMDFYDSTSAKDYGKVWLAYRHKVKEEHHAEV